MSAEMSNATVKEIVSEVTNHLFLCAWESPTVQHLTVRAAHRIVTNLHEWEKLVDVPRAPTLVPKVRSLNHVKELIKQELGIESNNVQDVIKEALQHLSEKEQDLCNACETSLDKSFKIAELLGLFR
jgi:hypothetical protein